MKSEDRSREEKSESCNLLPKDGRGRSRDTRGEIPRRMPSDVLADKLKMRAQAPPDN